MEKRVSKEGICKNTSFKLRKIVCYKKKQIGPFKWYLPIWALLNLFSWMSVWAPKVSVWVTKESVWALYLFIFARLGTSIKNLSVLYFFVLASSWFPCPRTPESERWAVPKRTVLRQWKLYWGPKQTVFNGAQMGSNRTNSDSTNTATRHATRCNANFYNYWLVRMNEKQ